MEGAVGVLAKGSHGRVQALHRISGVDHAGERAEDPKRLHKRAQVAGRRRRKKSWWDVWLHLPIPAYRGGPGAIPVGVENETSPVGRRTGADIHDRRNAETAP